MTRALDRWLPPLTLSLWSGMLLYFYLSGRLSAFLHPNFRPGVLIAGVLLLGLAIATLIGGTAETCGDDTCGHTFSRSTTGKLLTFGVFLFPFLLSFRGSEDTFGLTAINNRGVIMDAQGITRTPDDFDAEGYGLRKINGYYDLSVVDLLYAAQEPMLREDFDNKPVQIIGQLMNATESNPHGNRMKVIRMFMSCCAADARPVGALIELQTPTDIPELSWIKVTGTATFPTEGGRLIAVLKADSIEVTPPPEETMLY